MDVLLFGWLTIVGRAAITQRGFTGHEMAASVGIIHMNGRIYDPVIGRFLQADPYVKNPGSPQGLNRYSYVENNPLNLIDPSGYGWLSKAWKKVKKTAKKVTSAVKGVAKKVNNHLRKDFERAKGFVKKYGRVIVAAAVIYFSAGTLTGVAAGWVAATGLSGMAASVATGAIAGAMTGFAGGVIGTGTLKGGLQGALTGAVFGGIGGYGLGDAAAGGSFVGSGSEVAAHAVGGGATAKLNGGHALKGAITGGFNKYAGRFVHNSGLQVHEQVAAQAVVGGTSSVISGGKFENGAITAAIQYTVNEVAVIIEEQKAKYNAAQRVNAIDEELERFRKLSNAPSELRSALEGYGFDGDSIDLNAAVVSLQVSLITERTAALYVAVNGLGPAMLPNASISSLYTGTVKIRPIGWLDVVQAWPLMFLGGTPDYTANYSCQIACTLDGIRIDD